MSGEAGTRTKITQYLHAELVGPRNGEHEVLAEEPNRAYVAGTLFPQDASNEPVILEDEGDVTGSGGLNDSQDIGDDPVVLANQYLPASLGVSFYLEGSPGVRVQLRGAQYKHAVEEEFATTSIDSPVDDQDAEGEDATTEDVDESDSQAPGGVRTSRKRPRWGRQPFAYGVDADLVLQPGAHGRSVTIETARREGRLHAVWRDAGSGWLVTVTVINPQKTRDPRRVDPAACLFQVELTCRPEDGGRIRAYPRSRLLTEDNEERILDLLYRREASYGVGHGCAVIWDNPENGQVAWVRTEVLPQQSVPPITYDLPHSDDVMGLKLLADGEQNPGALVSRLTSFVDAYERWIGTLVAEHTDVPADLNDVRHELLDRLHVAVQRMRAGVLLLQNDRHALHAFCLANEAMLEQMVRSGPEYAGTRRPANAHAVREPELKDLQTPTWRPFQLAFQLLTLASVANEDDHDRRVVDLIWFPTGGGKTEAYLAVTAFLIFYRRLVHSTTAAGTAVLMRYTLRLLTTQQFRRAATLICACEMIRQGDPGRLGSDPISIGLWVGNETTPNRFGTARERYQQLLLEEHPTSPFQIDRCPWCGTELVPEIRQSDQQLYGIDATLTDFRLFCPTQSCPFHEELPVRVVDDDLYERPPTLVIGTVDKFARLPWEARAGAFFGEGKRRPPELIIQDELHLISGPLGTVVGLYETAIDALASWDGCAPKLLASTATIRRADEQCLGLYARPVQLFPPSGLEARDSYFARYDLNSPGRLYAGVLAPSHTGSTALIRVAAALLQAPKDLHLTGADLDAYWTLVAYHNSLRELGKSVTFGNDDIPARVKVLAQDRSELRQLNEGNVQELTSNIRAEELAELLERLNRTAQERGEISLLLCTNMLSVGVDVPRLGLMLVNGQPKSTSEYIQATSRVGRGSVPGLVVCVYSPSKPRDRSHYERFAAYHQGLYRYVEPTSVTPFARPARDRALHAVLVSLVRHRAGLPETDQAGEFRRDLPEMQRIARWITERVQQVDPREAQSAVDDLEQRLREWEARARVDTLLRYSGERQHSVLLRTPGDGHTEGWDTLQSMRNVDRSCLVKVQ